MSTEAIIRSSEATINTRTYDNEAASQEEFYAFPLTRAQAAMWPHESVSSADSRFNGAFRLHLAGRVDASLLERSLREIAQRHEALRTAFHVIGATVSQVVLSSSQVTVETLDLRGLPEGQRAAELDEISRQEAQQCFDLLNGVPMRVKLLRLEDERSVLTLTIHQILCDGWSIGLLMEELARIYAAFAVHASSSLPSLTFQFGDYVIWQQENLLHADVQNQLQYWKKRLGGYRPLRVTPDVASGSRSMEGGIVSELLSRELTDRLRQVSQAQDTTFFVVTLAACMALLSRCTGESDVAVRTPLAGRSRVEFEPIIGQFVNHVAIRSEVSSDITFAALVARVRESVWDALANQDAPFEAVLESLAVPDGVRSELFNINFVCQREYGRSGPFHFDFDGVTMTTLPSKSQGALYDLNFFLVEREMGWRLSLEYKTELYTQKTAEDLLRHLHEILTQVAFDPQLPIAELSPSGQRVTQRMEAEAMPPVSSKLLNDQSQPPSEMVAMPASLAQERFWTLSQLDPANPTFHIPVVLKLTGQLSISLLERSFQLLIHRHESLRTTFTEIDGELMQVIAPAFSFSLSQTKLEADGRAGSSSRVAAAIEAEVQRPFDLAALPLFRALLCQIDEQEHVLILTIHHVLADAWSVQVIQRELWTAYEDLERGSDVSFEPLLLQYADFSVWQRDALDAEAMQGHFDFWLKKLAGELPLLNFPTDHAPAFGSSYRGALETVLFPGELTRSLKEFAQTSDTTLFVVTLACFALLLARASNVEDLVVGSPVVNRRNETEPLIGPFAGPIALRVNLSGDPTFREFLASVRETTLEALDHTDLPFEALLEKLSVRPLHGRNPLFQFYFFCQPAFLRSRQLRNLTVDPLPTMSLGIPFELQLGVIEREEGVRAELEYSSQLFNAVTVRTWLEYYETILTRVIADPDQRISGLPQPPYQGTRVPKAAKTSAIRESVMRDQGELSNAHPIPGSVRELKASVAIPGVEADALTGEIRAIWETALGIPEIDLRADFFSLGGRSLVAARLMTKINRKFGLRLGLATLFKFPTIEGLADLIRGQLAPHTPSSIVAIQPRGLARALFIIHGVGGNVLNFYDLAKALGDDQPVYGIEAQALLPNGDPLTTLEELAAYYIREVRKIQPVGPYRFLGYSYGGFVVFEIARQLQAAHEVVELAGMLDTPIWRHGLHEGRGTVAKVGRQLRAVWSPFLHRLRPCTPKEIFDGVKSTLLRSLYTLVTSHGTQIPRSLRSVYHINSFAAVNYVPKTYNGKITMLRSARERGPRDLGWGEFTTQPVDVYEIPGAHFQVLSDENLSKVVQSLRTSFAATSKLY